VTRSTRPAATSRATSKISRPADRAASTNPCGSTRIGKEHCRAPGRRTTRHYVAGH
jgi:hypothetical protein